MVLKCPKCGKRGVTLESFKKTSRYGGAASKNYQVGKLSCCHCSYSEVFKGAF